MTPIPPSNCTKMDRFEFLEGCEVRVACVDDDPMILRLLTVALEKRLGAEVWGYSDPSVALTELREREPPDLLILDVMMPELDGYALFHALKAAWSGSEPRIIFLTAGGPVHRERALEEGAEAALEKPFQPNELAWEVARICGRELP